MENSLPGNSDWILTKPALKREVEGYMSRVSIQRGESISLYHNSKNAASVVIEVYRTGWYGGIGARRVFGPVTVEGVEQMNPTPDGDGRSVCKWERPYVILTTNNSSYWTTGIYLVKMTEEGTKTQAYAIFVVRDDTRPPDILMQLPTNTYQAYNYWGGKSLYRGAVKVSYDRPYACPENDKAAFGNGAGEYLVNIQPIHEYPISSSAGWNYNMVRWLERSGLDVGYIANTDVHTRLPQLPKPKLFLTQGHDEYWSWDMMDNVMAWRDGGVHLAFLGSNTAYWQIRYEDMAKGDDNSVGDDEPRTVVCYRRDRREVNHTKYRTVKWRQVRPEASLVGVEYHFPLGDPFDEDMIVANNKAISHWIFDGTGLKDGDKIPGMLGYEVDRIRTEWGQGQHAVDVTKLFETPLIDRKGRKFLSHGATYTASSGANVFAAGTMFWSWGLDDYGVMEGLRSSRLNEPVERMTWNIFGAADIRRSGEVNGFSQGAVSNVVRGNVTNATPRDKKPNPLEGWIYEPKNLQFFWKKLGDRPYQREFYSRLGGIQKFRRILDVGARGYNRMCKQLINSTSTEYYQMEPFPPEGKSEMNNDGLLEMYMGEVRNKRPDLVGIFDLIIDFGVFGWSNVQVGFDEDGIREYVDGVRFLLGDGGLWALKTDEGWVNHPEEFFKRWIFPHFEMGTFDDGAYESGHSVKGGKFKFYWFYKKKKR
uniref:N,N-dimethylformamidase beta subunit-like C-terminal domain-containing protein n=1 Tax=Odontella aurita TaxID=265563 RepID=A0A7S4MHL7_9STRA|mmetsp:Transcript_22110/g.65568  ORF Transcript_22110/g.65568 Transcript_22110/m.65568 type:complete len:705 (+) Transcript_22110:543-2657(+)